MIRGREREAVESLSEFSLQGLRGGLMGRVRPAIGRALKIMETGTGADRQLNDFEESKGDLKAVVDYMAAETRAGL
jgi:hypothetical protein